MNTINNIYKRLFKGKGIVCASLLASGLSLASCSDYLEILPLNEVVLENYWTKKDDVTSVLSGCYESLASEGCLDHMNVWGELRSENLVRGSNPDNKYSEILKENILPTNDLTKWEDLYKTINRCNTVLAYAEGVQKLDPNYTEAQMRANKAGRYKGIYGTCNSYEPSIEDALRRP